MRLRTSALSPTLTVVTILSAHIAQSQIVNGSFEEPLEAQNITEFYMGPAMPGWTVTSGTVEIVNNVFWDASAGIQSVDMSGIDAGTLAQTVTTDPGHLYTLDFDMSGNFFGGNAIKSMDVLINGANPQNFTFNTTGISKTNMGWVTHSITFTGTGSDTVSFESLENSEYGPTLDNVRLTDDSTTPEPGTPALVTALAVSGLAVLRRSRR